MIDGFVRDSSKSAIARTKVVSGQVHRRTQQARTLMRGGLKRPVVKTGPTLSRHASLNPERELRAKSTSRHHSVQRFGIPAARGKLTPAKTLSGELVHKLSPRVASQAAPAAAPLPSMITSASHQKLERLLDQALTQADSHKEALRYQAARHFWQRRRLNGRWRWLIWGTLLVLVLVGLFISYQKIPQISVKAAGMRAHLSPAVPTYIPDSYKMAGPAQAESGTVNIRYVSSGGSSYNIVQAQSSLNSQSVEQSVVPKGAPVQTSQVDGNTVYIYGRSNDAAWVNNGILYTIKDNANLSSDELIKIVQGLNP